MLIINKWILLKCFAPFYVMSGNLVYYLITTTLLMIGCFLVCTPSLSKSYGLPFLALLDLVLYFGVVYLTFGRNFEYTTI